MTKEERKTLKRIGDFFRMMADGANPPHLREQSRERLEALLTSLGKNWSDLTDLLIQEQQAEQEAKAERAAAQGATYNPETDAAVKPDTYPVIDLVYGVLARYLDLKEHEFVAATLWVMHTWVYDRYTCTPRLVAMSPIADCGKTTFLLVLGKLTPRSQKSDNASAASIYWLLDQRPGTTLLLDEMDNADLLRNSVLRSVINSGYQHGGTIPRVIDRKLKLFPTFAPMALAAINKDQPLPWPTLSRSLVINMQRSRKELERYDPTNTGDLDYVRNQLWLWAKPDLKLSPNPAMPKGLRVGRPRDKWRPLFAIADLFRPEWGKRARDAALAFVRNQREEEVSVQLLEDIRELFTSLAVDRFLSKPLVERLRALADSPWNELPLTEAKLAKILEPFGIKPGQIYPAGKRTKETKQGRGYLRSWFEETWRRYCDEETETPKSAKTQRLRGD